MEQETHVTEFLPEYALNCLDADETVMVSEHLATCQQCREEFETFQIITDQLALAVPEVQPPSDLKKRILEKVQPETRSVQERSVFQNWWQQFLGFFRPVAPAWGLASAVVILVLGISTALFWQRIQSLEQFYDTRDFQLVKLECTHIVPEATGQIVISKDGDVGALAVAHLPVLEAGYAYQIWLIQGGQRTSGGMFTVNQQGYGMLNLTASPMSLLDCEVSITVEPAEGSVEPTGDQVLRTLI